MKLKHVISVLIVIVYAISCEKNRQKDIFIIPLNYNGEIKIYFEEPSGIDVSSGDHRQFLIPPSGILKVRNKIGQGSAPDEFYFQGSKIKIPVGFVDRSEEKSVQIFGLYEFGSHLSSDKNIQTKENKKTGIGFFVGTRSDMEHGFKKSNQPI